VRAVYGPDEGALGEEAQRHIVPQTPGHALYGYIAAHGWEHASPEFRYAEGGAVYVAQVGFSASDQMQHVAYCREGEWGKVRHVDRRNA